MNFLYKAVLLTFCVFLLLVNLPAQSTEKNVNKTSFTLEGYVYDNNGNGVAGADVVIPERSLSVKTNQDGKFVFDLTFDGKVHIEVFKDGFMPSSTKPFSIVPGVPVTPPVINLEKSLLEEVVVTGTMTPKLYMESPVKTVVASKAAIENKGAVSLADSLEIVTGVRVENDCQNCNFTQVRINGMEGKYSQILINNMPIVSALAGVYALEQIPSGMIDKLEVVKGGGAALYGGNAVAGVVNVITREPQKSGTHISFDQRSIHSTGNSNLTFNSDYVSKNYNTYVTFFANYQDRQHMDYNNDGFSDHGELTNLSIGANFVSRFDSIGGKLKLGFTSIFEDRRGGNKFDLPEHMADIAEAARTYRTDMLMGWEQTIGKASLLKFDSSISYTKRKSYYGSGQDSNAYGSTKNPVYYGTLVFNNLSFHAHNILAGVSFHADNIEDLAPAYNRSIDETYTDLGFFIQDEIELFHDKASLLVGIRTDKHSEIDSAIISPRAGFVFTGIENLTFRSTFSTGFRAPQVFDEDLHITQVGGEGMIIKNRDGLEAEKSYSITVGLDYGNQVVDKLYRFSIGAFFHRLTNAFTMEEIESLPNARVFERFNNEGVKVGSRISTGTTVGIIYRMDIPEKSIR